MDSQLELTINNTKRLLINGFIRKQIRSLYPSDIKALIFQFYDEVNNFNIDSDQIALFQSGHNLFGEDFIVHSHRKSHRFRCALYPSRSTENFSLQTLFTEDMIKIVAYFFMFNAQRGTYFKGTLVFNEEDIVGNEERNPCDSKQEMWIKQDLNAGGIKKGNLDRLDLCIFCEILCVRYRDKQEDYVRDIKMEQKVEYKWTLKRDELKEWIECDSLKTFPSRNFPKVSDCYNWALTMIPNGFSEETNKMVVCYLDLLRMPATIKTLDVDFKIAINVNDTEWVRHSTFGYGSYSFTHMFEDEEINNDSFRDRESVDIRIEIEITKVIVWGGKVIEKASWKDFGILNSV